MSERDASTVIIERAPRGADASLATESQAAPKPALDEFRESRTPPTLAAALIAWALTLAPSAFGRAASWPAAALGSCALVAGLAGPLVARVRPRAGRHIGISLFAAFSTATWLVGSHAIHPQRLDPLRGVFGAMAWGVFALAWSERWGSRSDPAPVDADAPLLAPRASLPPLASALSALGVALALVYLAIAFRVADPERALVTQALALACAVAIVTASGVVATSRGRSRSTGGRRLTPPVIRALLLLVTTAVAGAVITALR